MRFLKIFWVVMLLCDGLFSAYSMQRYIHFGTIESQEYIESAVQYFIDDIVRQLPGFYMRVFEQLDRDIHVRSRCVQHIVSTLIHSRYYYEWQRCMRCYTARKYHRLFMEQFQSLMPAKQRLDCFVASFAYEDQDEVRRLIVRRLVQFGSILERQIVSKL